MESSTSDDSDEDFKKWQEERQNLFPEVLKHYFTVDKKQLEALRKEHQARKKKELEASMKAIEELNSSLELPNLPPGDDKSREAWWKLFPGDDESLEELEKWNEAVLKRRKDDTEDRRKLGMKEKFSLAMSQSNHPLAWFLRPIKYGHKLLFRCVPI